MEVVLQIGAGASSDCRKGKLAIVLACTGCQRYYYAHQPRPGADKGGLLPRLFSALLRYVSHLRIYLIPPIIRLEILDELSSIEVSSLWSGPCSSFLTRQVQF